jgi:hypothetical protein
MSGMEPGRAKIEEREAASIWNGTRILVDGGVEWTVIDWTPSRDDRDDLVFHLERKVNGEKQRVRRPMQALSLVRCRVDTP